MKFFILLVLSFFTVASQACEVDIIAFRGLNGHFDDKAFQSYVKKNRGCGYVYNWQETNRALLFINQSSKPYQLYGYSKGADSVRIILEKVNRMPEYVITIGAWKTVDLDFKKYGIKFRNYFDASGIGQRSPGIYLESIAHYQMQEAVNNLLWKVN